MTDKVLYAPKDAVTVTYGNKAYRVQNDRGHRHLVIYENSKRRKITIKEQQWEFFAWYILDGHSEKHPCIVMDWWAFMKISGKPIDFNFFYKTIKE